MRPAAKAAAAGLGAAAAAWLFQRLEAYLDSDDCWLALADRLRRAQTPPSQSSFRVSCVLALGSRIRGEYVAGCNVEANNLGNSVCAERIAFGALQMDNAKRRRPRRVVAVYIVCDAESPITSGLLCREFMYSSQWCDPSTRVITAAPGLEKRLEHTLEELLPCASPYARLDAAGQRAWAASVSLQLPDDHGGPEARAYAHAMLATDGDDRDALHPVRYGAAVTFADGTVASARQRKALEYGCTLDPVGQLAQEMTGERRPACLALVDQYGVCHAPFAPGRSFLVEHGFGGLDVLVHDVAGALRVVKARDLVPCVPDFTEDDFGETS